MQLFNSLPPQIVLQEVPGEVSLQFTITGCNLGCKGCHSPEIWDPRQGEPLDLLRYGTALDQYADYISCVLFFGGEWQPDALLPLLHHARGLGLKTCLYSGADQIPASLMPALDFLKLGPYRAELGGLDSKTTNQRFIEVASGALLNHKFVRP